MSEVPEVGGLGDSCSQLRWGEVSLSACGKLLVVVGPRNSLPSAPQMDGGAQSVNVSANGLRNCRSSDQSVIAKVIRSKTPE